MLRLIVGSGRSGTTWLLDVLADANGLRPVFEPLNTDTSTVGRKSAYAYLSRDFECDALKGLFSAAANGALNSIWTDYRFKPNRLHLERKHLRSPNELKALMHRWKELAKRYATYREKKARAETLVKCIRANLMLDWVHANFDARILFVLRHPGAVVESRLRFAEHWDPFPLLEKYRNDAALMNGPLKAQATWLDRKYTRAEALTAIWCVENLVPAAQAASNGYLIVFYEELLERPEVEWPRIVNGLGLDTVPSGRLLDKPSQQAAVQLKPRSATNADYSKGYGRWQALVTRDNLAQIDLVLQAFGVTFYSAFELRPNVEAFTQAYLSGTTGISSEIARGP